MLSCGPSCWSIAHASCSHGRCSCRPGYIPQVNTISTKTTLIIHHDNYHLFHHIIIMSCCSTPPSPHPDYPVVQLEQPTRLFSHLMEGASKSTDIIQVKRKSQNNNFSNIFLLFHLILLYSDGKIMNYWMFAMISIGCIFIVFVGVSIYILW